MCPTRRAERKQHMEHEIHKSGCVLHTTVFVDQALEGKKCTSRERQAMFCWATETHKMRTERAEERYERINWPKHAIYLHFRGPKSGFFDAKCSGSISKIMLPTEAGSTFFKQYEKNDCRGKMDMKTVKWRMECVHKGPQPARTRPDAVLPEDSH